MKTIDVRLNLPDGFDLKIIKISVTNTTQCPFHADMDHFRILDQAAPLAVEAVAISDEVISETAELYLYAVDAPQSKIGGAIEFARAIERDVWNTQPAVEPVAVHQYRSLNGAHHGWVDTSDLAPFEDIPILYETRTLYAQPQPAAPLAVERIDLTAAIEYLQFAYDTGAFLEDSCTDWRQKQAAKTLRELKRVAQPQPAVAVPQGVSDLSSLTRFEPEYFDVGVGMDERVDGDFVLLEDVRKLLATPPEATMLDRVKDGYCLMPKAASFDMAFAINEWCGGTAGTATRCYHDLVKKFSLTTPPTPPEAKVQVGDERELFEKSGITRRLGRSTEPSRTDDYEDTYTQFAWRAWQARASLATPQPTAPASDTKPTNDSQWTAVETQIAYALMPFLYPTRAAARTVVEALRATTPLAFPQLSEGQQ